MRSSRRRRRTAGNIITAIISLILIAILAWSGYNAWNETAKYRDGNKTYDQIQRDAQKPGGGINWAKLKKINPDIVAWIKMPQKDGFLNYPVVQTNNNSKYLHTLFNGTPGACGTLFIDKSNKSNFTDFNTIIYGHHMGRWFYEGPMFGKLERYKKQQYYDKHSWMWIYTPKHTYKLKICFAYTTPGKSNEMAYKISFKNEQEKYKYLKYTMDKSVIKSDFPVSTGNKYVTLSTCAYEYQNARLVVIGKLKQVM